MTMLHLSPKLLLTLILLALAIGCGKADNGGSSDGGDADADGDADGDSDVDTGFDPADLEWVEIEGGTFMMGRDVVWPDPVEESPAHEVTVPTFEILRTEVTVEQFAGCVSAGACTEPDYEGTPLEWDPCHWIEDDRDEYPMNCISWDHAFEFCEWAGGRLPSEAEWEYAAKSGGKDYVYVRDDIVPSCDDTIMVATDDDFCGCGEDHMWPVCSKPDGNTEHGLCDMGGNAAELVQDAYHPNYEGAPVDGSAWDDATDDTSPRAVRGLHFCVINPEMITTTRRFSSMQDHDELENSIRCARSVD